MLTEQESSGVREDWSLDKRGKFVLNCIIGSFLFAVLPINFAHFTETLLLIDKSWLVGYSLLHGLVFAISLEVFGRYEVDACNSGWSHLFFTLCSAGVSSTLLILIIWLIEYDFIGRYVIAYVTLGSTLLSFTFSVVLSRINSMKKTKVLLLVQDSFAERIEQKARELKIPFQWIRHGRKRSGKEESFSSFDYSADVVVPERMGILNEREVLKFVSAGTKISPIELFWCESFRSLPPEYVDTNWLMSLDLHLRSPFNKRVKRLLDLGLSFCGIIVLSPILLLASVAVVLESGFPLFFNQTRSGFMGNPYTLHKIRTMNKKAESSGPQWADKQDNRITRVGKFLRKWRIDEIPQLWNIMKGDMSVVGPRPERPEFDRILSREIPHWECRSLVKPGLTGWAQIRSQYASDEESSREKLAHDLYYIKYASFFFDLEIVLSTLRSLTKGSR